MDTTVDALKRIDQDFSGDLGIYAKRLDSGETIAYRADEPNQTASTIKTVILAEVFRQADEGRISLDDDNHLVEENTERTYGSGVLRELTVGLTLSVRDMCVLMMIVSDNVATNQMIDLVDLDNINSMAHSLEMTQTRINRKIVHVGDGSDVPFGMTTAGDFGVLFELLYRGEVVSPHASKAMLAIMMQNHYKTDITRYFPGELLRAKQPDADPCIRVASKSGTTRGVKCNAGIVYTPSCDYVISLFSRNGRDRTPGVDNENQVVLPKASRVIYDAFCGDTCRDQGLLRTV